MERSRAWTVGKSTAAPALAAVLALALVPHGAALAATYWVSTEGDDSNPGTSESPWRTIQQAADTIAPGDTVFVREGTYDERVTVPASGTGEGTRIVLQAESPRGARCTGFLITGDYVTVAGFEVEAGLDRPTGIVVDGGTGVEVRDCHVHDCPLGGIDVANGATQARITGNLLEHNGQWGVRVSGSYVLVEANEIAYTVQHHPKGDMPDFTGYDADGMRIHGDHHVIRSNDIHDIADPADAEHNIDPHADCIQTIDEPPGGRPVMTDTVIEGNHCLVNHPYGKGIMMSAEQGNPCHDLTIMNNVFEYRDEGICANLGLFENILVLNNVFKANLDDPPWGVSIAMLDVSGYVVENNIMVDCHAESRKIEGGSGVVDYNLVWFSSGVVPTGTPGPQPHELFGVDPLFASYSGAHGGDYHLTAGSPAIDAGLALAEVTIDRDGVPRPQGAAHDIGAYEYAPGWESDPVPDGAPDAAPDVQPDGGEGADEGADAGPDTGIDAPADPGAGEAEGASTGCGCALID